MALQAQRADVRQVAFAAALNDRCDMVGIPQCPARIDLNAPFVPGPQPCRSAQLSEVVIRGLAIGAANSAYAPVALEDLFPNVPGIAAELPLIDTPLRAEGDPAFGDFKVAPTA